MITSKDFYITSQEHLQQVVGMIRAAKIVALDTEFTRETTYYPILSIVQIGVRDREGVKRNFIVDCQSNIDLKDFFAVIADLEIIKILHSCSQDLQIFHCKSGLIPRGIVDTQVMANFCGFGFNIGYSHLVSKIFHRQLDKKQQRSDWQRRPLSDKQIEYALLDVVYLEDIYEKFFEILSAQERLDWFYEEMRGFVNKSIFKSEDNLSKNFSFRNKNSREISKIKDLISWRESWARKVDKPRQHFCRDEIIERMVINNAAENRKNFTQEMINEINKILDEKDEFQEKGKRVFLSQKQKNSYEEAKKLIAKIANEADFKEQFLLTSLDLKKVIGEPNLFGEIVNGWRYQLFGKELENLIYK